MTKTLDISFLQECLTYEAATGFLFWKHRPLTHFASANACGVWNSKHAGRRAGSPNVKRRWSTKINAVLHQNHRLAWALHYGCWPDDQIDHINGDPEDNRLINLRIVSNAENQRNAKRKQTNTSGATGVSWHKRNRVWQANIRGNGRFVYLGSFSRFEDAVAARKTAEQEYGYHPNHGRIG
jgi:hypothetical protein